jgi:hypothetical protein
MSAIVFIDTEFTRVAKPELLSLGMVTLDGRELYAELDRTHPLGRDVASRASDFVRETVFPQFGLVPGATGTLWEIGRRVGDWLLGLAVESQSRIEVAFDSDVDFVLLEQAIRDSGIWHRVCECLVPINIDPLTGTITGELAAEESYRASLKRGLGRHHSLADAVALRARYVAAKAAAIDYVRKATP